MTETVSDQGIEARKRSFGEVMLPYVRPRPIAAFLLGISSGFPLALLLAR